MRASRLPGRPKIDLASSGGGSGVFPEPGVQNIAARPQFLPGDPGQWGCGEPLWRRAPTRDEAGKPYNDFMLLAPRLNRRPAHEQEAVTHIIRAVLEEFDEDVVFAELNLKINVLWISIRQRPGLMAELVAALRARVPEFHLVGHNPNP
jgi:hypothetical protein